MIRIRRGLVVGQMAGNTFLGQSGIRTAGMATRTIKLMSTFQGKESMFEALVRPIPLPANHVVASVAIGAESGRTVVWSSRCLIVGTVTTVAIRSHYIIPLFRARHMASVAIGFGMHSYQWKAHLTVDILHFAVFDQPRFGGVATGAIVANRLLVHILVALVAIRGRILKNQRGVALFA